MSSIREKREYLNALKEALKKEKEMEESISSDEDEELSDIDLLCILDQIGCLNPFEDTPKR